jgi:hypothetical protein
MIVIGADTHKSTHALAAVDAGTGRLLAEREIVAKDAGHLEALRWAHELDGEIVWGDRGLPGLLPPSRASTPSRWRS